MNKKLFYSLRQQLIFEVIFATDIGTLHHDSNEQVDMFEFEYRGRPYKLVLNGEILLKYEQGEVNIESFQDLIQGLIKSNYSKKNVA